MTWVWLVIAAWSHLFNQGNWSMGWEAQVYFSLSLTLSISIDLVGWVHVFFTFIIVFMCFRWDGLKTFLSKDRTPLYCGNDSFTRGFTRSYKNFHFYWILGAGHFVSHNLPLSLLLSYYACHVLIITPYSSFTHNHIQIIKPHKTKNGKKKKKTVKKKKKHN